MRLLQRIAIALAFLVGITTVVLSHQDPIAPTLGAIEGRVVDAEGHSVAGVRVYTNLITEPGSRGPITFTDSDGKFFLNNLRSDKHMVHADKETEGYADTLFAFSVVTPESVPSVAVRERQTTRGVTVNLGPRSARLVGQVVDSETGLPISNAQITLDRSDAANPNMYISFSARSFDVLVPPVGFRIKVSARGYREWRYQSKAGKATTESLILKTGAVKELIVHLQPSR